MSIASNYFRELSEGALIAIRPSYFLLPHMICTRRRRPMVNEYKHQYIVYTPHSTPPLLSAVMLSRLLLLQEVVWGVVYVNS